MTRRRVPSISLNQALRTTLAALSPLGPCWHSNSTASPSFRVLYPFSWIAEKCTKTSSPVERWINPYPLAPLNHFTTPFSFKRTSFPTFINHLQRSSGTPRAAVPYHLRQILGHLECFESGETITPIGLPSVRTMNFCSSLMMLWQELESSARKICLAEPYGKTGRSLPAEAIFDRCAKGRFGTVRPVFRWAGHQGCTATDRVGDFEPASRLLA